MQKFHNVIITKKEKNMMQYKNGHTNHSEMTFHSDGSRKLTGNI